MEYVIDSNIAVKWFLPEPHSERAEALLNAFRHQGLGLIAPDLIIPEVVNTLWKQSVRKKEISLTEAMESCADFLDLQFPVHPSAMIAEHAFQFATAEDHSVYDALYIVLALQRGCEFVTADEKLIKKLSRKYPFIRWLGSLQLS